MGAPSPTYYAYDDNPSSYDRVADAAMTVAGILGHPVCILHEGTFLGHTQYGSTGFEAATLGSWGA